MNAPTGPQAQEAGSDDWMRRLAREIRANAEDHPADYISKFALNWANELFARAISATPARVVSDAFGLMLEALQGAERISQLWLPETVDVEHAGEAQALHTMRRNILAAIEAALSTLQSGAEGKDGARLVPDSVVERAASVFLSNVANHQKGMEIDLVAMRAAIEYVTADFGVRIDRLEDVLADTRVNINGYAGLCTITGYEKLLPLLAANIDAIDAVIGCYHSGDTTLQPGQGEES